MAAEIGQAEQQGKQQRYRQDLDKSLREQRDVVVEDRRERGVVDNEIIEVAEQVHHDPEHGKRVEAVQQRPRKFPQQIFGQDAHCYKNTRTAR